MDILGVPIVEFIAMIVGIITGLDIILGALPNSWVPWKSKVLAITGKITTVLNDFDIKKK